MEYQLYDYTSVILEITGNKARLLNKIHACRYHCVNQHSKLVPYIFSFYIIKHIYFEAYLFKI